MNFEEIEPYCDIFLYMNKYNHDEELSFSDQNESKIYEIIFLKLNQNEANIDQVTNFFKRNNVKFSIRLKNGWPFFIFFFV
jgi:hypothetical protein